MHYKNVSTHISYMKYKRTDLKWYQKLWNYITGHKDRNWTWVQINRIGELDER